GASSFQRTLPSYSEVTANINPSSEKFFRHFLWPRPLNSVGVVTSLSSSNLMRFISSSSVVAEIMLVQPLPPPVVGIGLVGLGVPPELPPVPATLPAALPSVAG